MAGLLQQLRDGAGFLLSSSECSRRTGRYWLWQVEKGSLLGEGCLDFLGITEMRSEQKLEKEKGTGMWGVEELPWQWPSLWGGKEQSRPQSCQLLCHVSSLQGRGRPAKPAWKRSHVAGHSPRGAWSGKATSSCSLGSRMLCVSVCPCPQ